MNLLNLFKPKPKPKLVFSRFAVFDLRMELQYEASKSSVYSLFKTINEYYDHPSFGFGVSIQEEAEEQNP